MTALSTARKFGFVGALLDDPTVEEIIVLGGHRTFVVRDGVKELLPEVVDTPTVRRIADQLLAGTGRRLDLASPIVSAQLPDGSRVHITGPPVTHPDRLNIQIRKFVVTATGLSELTDRGTLTPNAAQLLGLAMRNDATVLVAGAPRSGEDHPHQLSPARDASRPKDRDLRGSLRDRRGPAGHDPDADPLRGSRWRSIDHAP